MSRVSLLQLAGDAGGDDGLADSVEHDAPLGDLEDALEVMRHDDQRQVLFGAQTQGQVLQIAACDRQIEAVLRQISGPGESPPGPREKTPAAKRPGVNAPQIEGLHGLLVKLCGDKDVTVLPAHTDYSLLQLLGEVGTDLTPWPTEKHFTAWLGLAPGSHQSGKRKGSVGRKRNRAGRLFSVMGRSLARSKHIALGGYYRRMAGRRGGLGANIALARKLAEWFWRVMVKGVSYVEQGLAQYEAQVLETKRRALQRLAKQLGHVVLPSLAELQRS